MNTTTKVVTANYACLTDKYYADVVLPAFSASQGRVAVIERRFRIAGKTLLLRFRGQAMLEKLAPALEHNAVAETAVPDVTVDLWDSFTSETEFTSPLIGHDNVFVPEVGARIAEIGGVRGVYLEGEQTMTFYDTRLKRAMFWARDVRHVPFWVSAAPLRTFLHWLLSETDTHLLHGAVVGIGGKSVLLTAKGGSGKSTTALSCLLGGMDYLADDYAAIKLGDTVTAYSLYNSVKVAPDRVPSFGEIDGHVWNKEGEKSIVFLADLFPERLPSSATLSAILIPVIMHLDRSEIVPAKKSDALLALLPTTALQLHLADISKFSLLKEIIERTPCFFLRLGSDSREAASVVRAFLDEKV